MTAVNVILVCGHECPDPAYLRRIDPKWIVVAGGRALAEAIDAVRVGSSAPVCVVPMTLGRDPGLVADAARAASWARRESDSPPVMLARPLGESDHLVGWLRGRAVAASTDALLISAPAGSPFEDAELFRIARLVRQFGPVGLVEVALLGGDPDLADGIDRCRRLGAAEITVVPAWLGLPARHGVVDGGPLLGDAALRGVVEARVTDALHLAGHGNDGIDHGLGAEHGQGFAHSHGPGPGISHGHGHGHGHTH